MEAGAAKCKSTLTPYTPQTAKSAFAPPRTLRAYVPRALRLCPFTIREPIM